MPNDHNLFDIFKDMHSAIWPVYLPHDTTPNCGELSIMFKYFWGKKLGRGLAGFVAMARPPQHFNAIQA